MAAVYFAFRLQRRIAARDVVRNPFAWSVVGGVALSVGVLTMVCALAIVGVVGGATDSAARAFVHGLFQAAFVFSCVALLGIVLSAIGLFKFLSRIGKATKKAAS